MTENGSHTRRQSARLPRFLPLTDGEIFAEAERMMRENKCYLDPALTMEVLAGEIGVHRNSLSRAVNTGAEMTFPDWLASFRVSEVERLAVDSGESPELLAPQAGFSNRTSFYKVFKKLRGSTPATYFGELRTVNQNNE